MQLKAWLRCFLSYRGVHPKDNRWYGLTSNDGYVCKRRLIKLGSTHAINRTE
jgi:hypothetical protein